MHDCRTCSLPRVPVINILLMEGRPPIQKTRAAAMNFDERTKLQSLAGLRASGRWHAIIASFHSRLSRWGADTHIRSQGRVLLKLNSEASGWNFMRVRNSHTRLRRLLHHILSPDPAIHRLSSWFLLGCLGLSLGVSPLPGRGSSFLLSWHHTFFR